MKMMPWPMTICSGEREREREKKTKEREKKKHRDSIEMQDLSRFRFIIGPFPPSKGGVRSMLHVAQHLRVCELCIIIIVCSREQSRVLYMYLRALKHIYVQ